MNQMSADFKSKFEALRRFWGRPHVISKFGGGGGGNKYTPLHAYVDILLISIDLNKNKYANKKVILYIYDLYIHYNK